MYVFVLIVKKLVLSQCRPHVPSICTLEFLFHGEGEEQIKKLIPFLLQQGK